jgi:hypothetical protein
VAPGGEEYECEHYKGYGAHDGPAGRAVHALKIGRSPGGRIVFRHYHSRAPCLFRSKQPDRAVTVPNAAAHGRVMGHREG